MYVRLCGGQQEAPGGLRSLCRERGAGGAGACRGPREEWLGQPGWRKCLGQGLQVFRRNALSGPVGCCGRGCVPGWSMFLGDLFGFSFVF